MEPNQQNQPTQISKKSSRKNKRFLLFLFALVTLFLFSFTATSFILINSYRLTFTDENSGNLQQELELLKSEMIRKEVEIEELKLQLANLQGESSFVNELLNADNHLEKE